MPIQALTRIVNSARVSLPGALDSAILYELFPVLDEFCQATNIWQEDINFSVNTLSQDYVITPSSGNILRLVGIQNSDGIPVWGTMQVPTFIFLKYMPSKIDVYTAKVALSVVDPVKKDGYPVIPDWILINFNRDITEGLLARMMSQKSKPYSDEKLGIYYLRRWRNAMAKARTDAQHQNLMGGQAWRFPAWASYRNTRF